MANRNAKLIERTLKDFSLGVMEGGGSGTKVVTELPKVGEEHTVYELRQEKPADFPWLLTEFDRTGIYPMPDYPFIVVETEEQVTQEYLAFHDGYSGVIVFVKNTSNVYVCHIEHLEDDDSFVKNIVLPEEHSLYNNIAILKDFDYHVTDTSKRQEPTRKPAIILDGTGHFLDGTEFNYDEYHVVPLVLTEAKNPIILSDKLIGNYNCKNINDTSELPTAKQAVDGNMCNSDGNVMFPVYINTQNKLGYDNETSTDTYSWNAEEQKFGVVGSSPFVEYTGDLEWSTETISVINKIDTSLLDIGRVIPVFNPQPAHTEVSYWIYTNDEWVNIDEIPDPNMVKIGITCTNGNWDVRTLPLNTITVTYDDVDYNVTQYAVTEVPTEQGMNVTYYGYIEVPMSTQANLTHTIKVSTIKPEPNWWYEVIKNIASELNNTYPTGVKGILAINIYYEFNA